LCAHPVFKQGVVVLATGSEFVEMISITDVA
jgi:hypothetical protein